MKLACGTMMDVMTKAPKGAKLMGSWISPKMLKLLMPPARLNGEFGAILGPRHDQYLLAPWQLEGRILRLPGVRPGAADLWHTMLKSKGAETFDLPWPKTN